MKLLPIYWELDPNGDYTDYDAIEFVGLPFMHPRLYSASQMLFLRKGVTEEGVDCHVSYRLTRENLLCDRNSARFVDINVEERFL